jgi:DNA-binding NarL/FixJ family response regulator
LNNHELELVGTASTGSEAVQVLPKLRPNVVLLDLNLPEVNGFEVLDLVRRTLPPTKVIILTSYNDKLLAEKARKAGAAAYLLKDTDGETLLQIVRDLTFAKE